MRIAKTQLVAKLGTWRTIESVRCFDKSKQKQRWCAEDYQASIKPKSRKISRILLPTSPDYKPRYCFYSLQSDMLHGDVTKLTATSAVKSLTQIDINIGLVSFGFRLSPHASCFIPLKSPLRAVSLSSLWASQSRLVRDTLFIPVPYYNGLDLLDGTGRRSLQFSAIAPSRLL